MSRCIICDYFSYAPDKHLQRMHYVREKDAFICHDCYVEQNAASLIYRIDATVPENTLTKDNDSNNVGHDTSGRKLSSTDKQLRDFSTETSKLSEEIFERSGENTLDADRYVQNRTRSDTWLERPHESEMTVGDALESDYENTSTLS